MNDHDDWYWNNHGDDCGVTPMTPELLMYTVYIIVIWIISVYGSSYFIILVIYNIAISYYTLDGCEILHHQPDGFSTPTKQTLPPLKQLVPYLYWLVVWNIVYFSITYGIILPNWLIFFRGAETTNQWWSVSQGKLGSYLAETLRSRRARVSPQVGISRDFFRRKWWVLQ